MQMACTCPGQASENQDAIALRSQVKYYPGNRFVSFVRTKVRSGCLRSGIGSQERLVAVLFEVVRIYGWCRSFACLHLSWVKFNCASSNVAIAIALAISVLACQRLGHQWRSQALSA